MTAPRWSDDAWAAMREDERAAWRAGYEAARRQAMRAVLFVPIPEDASPAEAHGRLMSGFSASCIIAAMVRPG